MIWLRGGASHIDSYDMKPDAPAEIRGEFKPIRTNVPGIQVCEHLPLHAKMMDKLAILRGIQSNDLGDHTPHYILTGFPDRGKRPVFGSVVSYLQPQVGRPAALRQPDVQAAGPLRQRGPDLHRPGPPAVRAQGGGAGEPEPGEGRLARPPAATARDLLEHVRHAQPRGRSTGAVGGDRRLHASRRWR